MPLSIRALAVLALAGALFAILFTKSSAEPPEAELKRVFERAANNEFEPGGTGDGILDDVIEVMRQRGSIASRLPADPWMGEERPEAEGLEEETSAIPGHRAGQRVTQKAIAAEQMLRAARLLEKVGESEPDRLALIKRMRSEARQLLLRSE